MEMVDELFGLELRFRKTTRAEVDLKACVVICLTASSLTACALSLRMPFCTSYHSLSHSIPQSSSLASVHILQVCSSPQILPPDSVKVLCCIMLNLCSVFSCIALNKICNSFQVFYYNVISFPTDCKSS